MAKPISFAQDRTQVLVVGAGPVGLLAALRLRQRGVEVRVVEQQTVEHARTFPVVLHPRSLELLNELGLASALYWRGRPITRLAVYADCERRAVLDLPAVSGIPAGALTLPQDVLRQALVNELAQRGVEIEWNTRLAVLQQDQGAVWGRLLRADSSGTRRATPDVSAFEASFVIGADGYESTVREALGIELVQHGHLESYAFFDTEVQRAGSEAQLAISDDFASSVYPLQGGLARFSFQITRGLHHTPDVASLCELIHSRLPWYAEEPDACEWSGVAEFRHALVTRFGRGRVWLAGEAAHLTSPLGVQSLNIGLDEANELALLMSEQLARSIPDSFGADYEHRRQRQWHELLGMADAAAPVDRSPTWARHHRTRLLSCLPASGRELDDLLDQLRLKNTSSPPALRVD